MLYELPSDVYWLQSIITVACRNDTRNDKHVGRNSASSRNTIAVSSVPGEYTHFMTVRDINWMMFIVSPEALYGVHLIQGAQILRGRVVVLGSTEMLASTYHGC